MKASDVLEHFKQAGAWVNWEQTGDRIWHGDGEARVRGIATAWMATNAAIRAAADRGLDLFISHEYPFFTEPSYAETASGRRLVAEKQKLLDDCGITLLQCHDTWDRMPDVGICDAWATFLGFDAEPRPVESICRICLVGKSTVEQLAQQVLEKVRPLGQDTVLVFGDKTQTVSRMAVGTGGGTHLPSMLDAGADVFLATDDGVNSWVSFLWATDQNLPLLIVNHAVSEKPGMQAMAGYLKGVFPEVPVEYVDVAYPYSAVV